MNTRPENKVVRHYQVEISDSYGVLKNRNEFSVKEINVLAENERYVVLDNSSFTVLSREKDYCNSQIEKPRIDLDANDSVWGNRIYYSLYTLGTVRASTIKKQIEKEVAKKFGFFMRGLNLDIVSDKSMVVNTESAT